MSSYDITCSRCKAPVTHQCQRWQDHGGEWRTDHQFHENPLVHAFIKLCLWKPENGLLQPIVAAMKQSDWYDEGDEKAPFFSQAVIYPLLGVKDEARTFFSLFDAVIQGAGFSPLAVKMLARKISVSREHAAAAAQGGVLPAVLMPVTDWVPDEFWEADLAAEGVGTVTVSITAVSEPGHRGDWDRWIVFAGGGKCHFRRLLRVARSIRDADGRRRWPLPEEEE